MCAPKASGCGPLWATSGGPSTSWSCVTERYEKTKDLIGGIAYPASRYGVVLYEAA